MGDAGVPVDGEPLHPRLMATLRDMVAPPSPPVRRPTARRDLRLAVGAVLVLLAMLLGARLLSSAGDRTDVWSLRVPLAAGTTLRADDLVAVPVAGAAVTAYVPASTAVVGKVLVRDAGAGELLAVTAVAEATPAARRLVTVAVDPLHSPPGLARGERVDVYVTPKDGASVGGAVSVLPALVLSGALVADPGSADQANGQVGVVLDVAAKDADRAVAAARGGDVDLVRVGS